MFVLFAFLSLIVVHLLSFFFFFFNDTATTEIYTLSLHDALPISASATFCHAMLLVETGSPMISLSAIIIFSISRSEEHTSELQSHLNLVCRLLLEKKKIILEDKYIPRDKSLRRRTA